MLKARDASLPDQLHGLILDPALGGPAVRGLSAYHDPATPTILLESYAKLGAAERRDVLNTMASRREWGRALLGAVEADKVPRGDLTADLVRQLRNLRDPDVDSRIKKVWGASARRPPTGPGTSPDTRPC